MNEGKNGRGLPNCFWVTGWINVWSLDMLFDDAFIVLSPEWIGRCFVRFRDATVEMSHFPQLFHQTLQGKQNNNALLFQGWILTGPSYQL